MDVSTVGAANSAQYLQRATNGLQAPLTPVKQEEQAAQVIAQVAAQTVQPQQQPKQPSADDVAKSGVGRVLDIQA